MVTLQELQLKAVRQLAESPSSSLALSTRHLIWGWMNSTFGDDAHKRRLLLNVLILDGEAVPAWNRYYTTDVAVGPQFYLQLCKEFLSGRISRADVKSRMHTDNADLSDLVIRDDDSSSDEIAKANAGFVAIAARTATTVAIYDEYCLRFGMSGDNQFIEPDPDLWDCHYLCSLVAANGAEWDESSDVAKRRGYWERWLRKWLDLACSDLSVALSYVEPMK